MALQSTAAWAVAERATGAEIAWALRRVGCETRLAGPEHVSVIRGGYKVALLPLTGTLHAATLRALLRTFAVTPEQLSEYLSDPEGRRDV